MAAKSIYLDDKVLAAVLTDVSYTSPTTVYVALYTTAPTPSTSGTEVSDANYSRQAATFSTPSGGSTSNTGVLSFFGSGAATAVGSVVAVAILDASTSGNILYFGNLTTAKTIGIGDTMSFAASALSVTEA
jgi:hypothetical protein